MDKKVLWRVLLIVAVVAAAGWSLWPPSETIHLGLDLSGGIHLVLEVQTDDAIKAEIDDAAQRFASLARDKGVELGSAETDIAQLQFRIVIPEGADRAVLREVANDYLADYDLSQGAETWTFRFPPNLERIIRDQAVRKGLETIRNRIDQFGVSEPVIQRQGLESDRILIQLPGVDDPARVKEIISSTAFLEFKEVVGGPAPDRQSLLAGSGGQPPPDAEVVQGNRTGVEGQVIGRDFFLLKKASIITGRELRMARRSQDEYGQPVVHFDLVPAAASKFGEYTGSHIGTFMAIVLDGKVMSAPRINARITDSGIIEGNFSIQEAEDLALVLRAGALPASITYLEERTVGPSLGRDSMVRGVRAAVIGLVVVLLFMLVYYKLSGLNANVALVLNIVLLLGAMAYFGATLTLPGIAGVILTIGMAVDANVLIFERIREELGVGKTVRAGDRHRFLPRLRDHSRRQPDDPDRRPVPVPVRHRAGQGLRGHPERSASWPACSPRCSCPGPCTCSPSVAKTGSRA